MREELLVGILEITKKQHAALEEDDIDLFELLLKKRQILLDEVAEFNEVHTNEKTERETEILEEIKGIETINQIEFKRQYEEAKQKLKEARQMKKREDFYSNPYGIHMEEGVFFDKKRR